MKKLSLVLVTSAVLMATGCTHHYVIDATSCSFKENAPKNNISVGLILSEELKTAGWQKEFMGDHFVMDLGDQFAEVSRCVAKVAFASVLEASNKPGIQGQVDAYLIAKVSKISRTMGATAFGRSDLSVVFEWRFEDKDGKLIWVDTIHAKGTSATGNIFSHKKEAKKQGQMMMEDLMNQSHHAISNAVEIKRFVASVK